MENLIIGFEETMDEDIISQGPLFIDHCVKELDKLGVPMITPEGEWNGKLRALEYFKQVATDGFTVVWPDGQDICPDELYYESTDTLK